MTPEYLVHLADWGMNIAFWSSVTFPPVASIFWPWWKSSWGINIVMLELAIALALLGSIINIDFGVPIVGNMALTWTIIIALWLVGIIVIWRSVLVVMTQWHGVRKARNGVSDGEHTTTHR